jgi:hypothetical protein
MKDCPSQDPVLRIETGMHVALIKHIGVDRACRIAATGSWDKTVRVWSLPDGRLLRTLRAPIGSGHSGEIYATAVSPDGRWVAAGGYDARSDIAHENFVYIFDASTGTLAARVGPFEDYINHLAFSPDGRWLAAVGGAAAGLKVDMNVLMNTVSASENGGIVVFPSSTGRQVSVETSELGNGAFTKAVVEGIALGKADLLGDGFITTSSLDTYVVHRVQQFTENRQTPVMERPPEQPDFAIAEVHRR